MLAIWKATPFPSPLKQLKSFARAILCIFVNMIIPMTLEGIPVIGEYLNYRLPRIKEENSSDDELDITFRWTRSRQSRSSSLREEYTLPKVNAFLKL